MIGLALACFAIAGPLPGALPATDEAVAHTLSKKRARKAAYELARRVGRQEGAVYAIAGFCRRKSRHRVNCWAGIIWADYSGAAQKVKVTLRARKVRAKRYGRTYYGSVGERGLGTRPRSE